MNMSDGRKTGRAGLRATPARVVLVDTANRDDWQRRTRAGRAKRRRVRRPDARPAFPAEGNTVPKNR